ncbi:PDZ domain-containing protein 11-like [Corticium candelabrum]|uniref:PDZ domain-containing protein 11-like n=1 Tax=Corticium candelabrum TaxID=121492 RepID=UPI002E25AC40|nr:PDZ domain-containing protein 11-like [Corticium candelabrum]
MSLQRQPSKSEKMITVHLPHYDPPPEWIPPEERDSDPDYSGNLADFLPRTIVLKRPHPSTQIGFHIRGGKEYRSEIYISKVISDTEAEKLGLKIGDQILAVNGVSFGSLDHPEAVKILKSTSDIEMTLKYYPYGYRKTFASRKFSRRSSTPNTM